MHSKTEPELARRFNRVNRVYFGSDYPQVKIIWSKDPLAINHHGCKCWARFYNSKLFIINICLKDKCPNYVLEYLIYHECLHRYWLYHCRGFNKKEQEFKHFSKAAAWLENHGHMIKAGRH